MNAPKLLEILRIVLAIIGFGFAYSQPAQTGLFYLLVFVFIPMTGLTGIESICFSKAAAKMKGREAGSGYQIQSACNNLAVAIAGILVLVFKFNVQAQLAIGFVALIFFGLSAIYHAKEYFIDKKQMIHLQRVILTIVLWAASLPIMLNAVVW